MDTSKIIVNKAEGYTYVERLVGQCEAEEKIVKAYVIIKVNYLTIYF